MWSFSTFRQFLTFDGSPKSSSAFTILQYLLHIGPNICSQTLELRFPSTRPILIRVAVTLHPRLSLK